MVSATAMALSDVRPRSLEATLCSPLWFGLETATPIQRAICRVADGQPLRELSADPDVLAAIGGAEAVSALPLQRPRELYVVAAIRTAKSLLAAALAVRATQTCDLSHLRDSEPARVSVVSLRKDLAGVIYAHLVGALQRSPALRQLLVTEPTADTITLRHPSGAPVEIRVVAGARAGGSLVARWSAGVVFDEAPRMLGASDAVVNFEDARTAVLGRLLPGAQLVAVGSPWVPIGPVYETDQRRWGQPGPDCVVVRGTGPAMNPAWWTPERVEIVRVTDEQTYRADCLGEWIDVESSAFDGASLESARQPWQQQRHQERHHYVAATDPATRGNGWPLVVGTWTEAGTLRVVYAREWRSVGGEPLSPRAVLSEMARELQPYGVQQVLTDQWAAEPLAELAHDAGLYLVPTTITAASKAHQIDTLRTLLATGHLELPAVDQLLLDLRRVRRVVSRGAIRVEYPLTADGRHCDYAAALALLTTAPQQQPDAEQQTTADGWTQPELDDVAALVERRRRARYGDGLGVTMTGGGLRG